MRKNRKPAEVTIINEKIFTENNEEERRTSELAFANSELAFQSSEKEKRAAELVIANDELHFQNLEKEKRAAELILANKELVYQNIEKEKRAAELVIANKELLFQNGEKEKRASELIIANKELVFQNAEKEKRAEELLIANEELDFQNREKEKRTLELLISNSQLKKAEESLKHSRSNLEAIIENSDAHIYSLDRNFRYITFNELLRNSMKVTYDVDLKIGDIVYSFLDKLGDEEKSAWQERYSRAFSGDVIKFEKEFIVKGESYFTSFSLHPIWQNEEVIGLACFATDISAKKHDELHKEKITADLMQRNKDLEQFTYIVSHNLRAPVANILGFSEELKDETYSALNVKKFINSLSISAMKLDGVIKDLNNILQVRDDKTELRIVVNLSNLVNDIKISLDSQIKKDQIEINFDFSEIDELLTVKTYLQSIFYNLISNSIKYRKQGSRSIIEIKSEIIKNKAVIIFTDNGMGIDMNAKSDQVFGLYKRFHTHIEGKGMGLYMCRTQIEMLGGTIEVESEINIGAKFILTLPLNEE